MPLLKVCGITRTADALWCEQNGVWALGFIQVKESPRYCGSHQTRIIIQHLAGRSLTVGVFQDTPVDLVNTITRHCGFDLVQLHGDETPEECRAMNVPVIKAFGVYQGWSPEEVEPYLDSIDMILFDNRRGETRGGTGNPFDWDVLPPFDQYPHPVILAGGLGAVTIPRLLNHRSPYALDCNSQVEKAPGEKDLPVIQGLLELISLYSSWKTSRKKG